MIKLYPEIEIFDLSTVEDLIEVDHSIRSLINLRKFSGYTLVDDDDIVPTTKIFYNASDDKIYSSGVDLNKLKGCIEYSTTILPTSKSLVGDFMANRFITIEYIYPINYFDFDEKYSSIHSRLPYKSPNLLNPDTKLLEIKTIMGGLYLIESTKQGSIKVGVRSATEYSFSTPKISRDPVINLLLNYSDMINYEFNSVR